MITYTLTGKTFDGLAIIGVGSVQIKALKETEKPEETKEPTKVVPTFQPPGK